ncbi:MAG: SAF domain-containing protein [Acidimicrobiia bacterium]|nr:SAF domain-containing protein [Acidimicrobiia bacterium]
MAVLSDLAGMGTRVNKRTLVAVGLASAAAFFVLALTRPDASVGVLVAAQDIPAGAALEGDLVTSRQMAAADGLIAGTDVGELEGWALATGVAAGEPLLPSLLVDPSAVPRASSLSISIAEAHAALGSIVAGDSIDIYVTWPSSAAASRRTELLAAGVLVLEAREAPDAIAGRRDLELLLAVDESLAPLIAGGHRSGDLDLVRVSK